MQEIFGTPVFDITLRVTQRLDFGQSIESALAGDSPIPPLGLRIDYYLEGEISGSGMVGTMHGIDYFELVGDGTGRINAHDVIETEDGARIAVKREGSGVAHLAQRKATLRETMTMHTASAKYAWVNGIQFWLVGENDMVQETVTLQAYTVPMEISTT